MESPSACDLHVAWALVRHENVATAYRVRPCEGRAVAKACRSIGMGNVLHGLPPPSGITVTAVIAPCCVDLNHEDFGRIVGRLQNEGREPPSSGLSLSAKPMLTPQTRTYADTATKCRSSSDRSAVRAAAAASAVIVAPSAVSSRDRVDQMLTNGDWHRPGPRLTGKRANLNPQPEIARRDAESRT